MLIRCSRHGGIIGERPPFGILEGKNFNLEISSTICSRCKKEVISGKRLSKPNSSG